ncbi:MAG: hypothetical protein AABY83_12505 [Pseudomonadota bacterium]
MRRTTRLTLDPPDLTQTIAPLLRDERSGGIFSPSLEAYMQALLVAVLVGIAAFYAASAAALFGM